MASDLSLISPELEHSQTKRARNEQETIRVAMVTHYMPPHIGGIELMADSLFKFYTAIGFEVRWIASRVPRSALASEEGRIRVSCLNLTEHWLSVPWPIWGPGGVRELERIIDWADIVHVHDCLYFGSVLAVLFARRWNKPVLVSQHIGFGMYPSVILNAVESIAYHTLGRVVLGCASHLVFCTPTAKEYVSALLGPQPVRSSSISHGIETDRFHLPTPSDRADARRELSIPDSRWVVLFVGRLMKKKGARLFLEVSRLMPSIHFLLVGDGPVRPGPARNVTWVPFVEPERIHRLYHAADSFMLPSHSEGFPISVLEAMASGVPVIIPKGESFTRLLEEKGACIVAERTPAALCEALIHLRETPAIAREISVRARELVVENWSLNAMGTRYVELIHDLIMKE